MSTHDSYVIDWLKQLVHTSIDAHLHNLDWDAITDSIDWSDIEIDYSSLVDEIDECQLADNVAEDIDWSDVVAEKFEEYMNEHFSRDDIMDKLGTDVSDMMETAIHEHTSLWRTALQDATKFNKDYQESLNKRLEALENRKPWWRFW